MAVTNGSFEDAATVGGIDRPGLADQWQQTNGGTSWEWAVFDSFILLGEDFEVNWSSNHERKTEFTSGQLDAATFDTTNPESFEDFEEEWSSNENRKTEFLQSQLDDASFDAGTPEAFEDFEEEWSSNEDRRTAFGGGELDDASFDTGTPEAFEDFEEEWNSNEDRRTVFGGGELDDAVFQTAGGTAAYENFDDVDNLNIAISGLGTISNLDVTQENRIIFSSIVGDTIVLLVQRDGFASWETYDTITTDTEVDLPSGYKAVRTNRTGGSGHPSAVIFWPELTQL